LRHKRQMAVLLIDIDHFKKVNDTLGHLEGDRVLTEFVANIKALLRGADLLGRFGGEEFVVLLPETTPAVASSVAQRVRSAMSSWGGPTVSVGVTSSRANGDSVDALLARADAAMYRAKSKGRNRVETA
jgi:diguanylate cyclase (GGDEF)-like protein